MLGGDLIKPTISGIDCDSGVVNPKAANKCELLLSSLDRQIHKSILNQCLDKFIPTKINSPPENLPWLTPRMDMAQWLERSALPMSLPAVRFRIPVGAGFSEKYHVSPLSILGHC